MRIKEIIIIINNNNNNNNNNKDHGHIQAIKHGGIKN